MDSNKLDSTEKGARKSVSESIKTTKAEESEKKDSKIICSYRFLIAVGAFGAFFNATLLRIGTVMAMVCMTEKPNENIKDDPDCPSLKAEPNSETHEFRWTTELQGFITSGVFYGFLIGPFVAGFLSYKYGGKIILVIGAFFAGLTHAVLPELTRVSPYLFFTIRIATGFFAGMIFPATLDILSHWVIPEERQTLVGGALIGVPLCSVVNFPINGLLCMCCTWVSIFYSSTLWLVLFAILAYFFMFDSPQVCPYVSLKEIHYIVPKVPGQLRGGKVPWRKILTSSPIYAYIFTHFCINYGFITVILHLPLFMKEVHHFQLSSNSFLSAAPYLGSLFSRIIITFTFNKIRNRLKITTNRLRKANVFIGVFIPTIALIAVSVIPCKYRYLSLACFIIFSTTLEVSITGGYLLSLLDMCPSYTNILSGIANAFANFAGLLSSLLTGFLITGGTHEEWNTVFFISIGLFILAGMTYILFGSNELQPWGLVKPGTAPHSNAASSHQGGPTSLSAYNVATAPSPDAALPSTSDPVGSEILFNTTELNSPHASTATASSRSRSLRDRDGRAR